MLACCRLIPGVIFIESSQIVNEEGSINNNKEWTSENRGENESQLITD